MPHILDTVFNFLLNYMLLFPQQHARLSTSTYYTNIQSSQNQSCIIFYSIYYSKFYVFTIWNLTDYLVSSRLLNLHKIQ
jgi:hypothetical protein